MNINRFTYTEYFLLYIDNELGEKEKLEVESFIKLNPDMASEMELLRGTTFTSDTDIVFGDRSSLFRTEEKERKVIPFFWSKMAVAAILLISLGVATWKYIIPPGNHQTDPALAKTNPVINNSATSKVSDPVLKPAVAEVTPMGNRKTEIVTSGIVKAKQQVIKKSSIKKASPNTDKLIIVQVDNNQTENTAVPDAVLKHVTPKNKLAVNNQQKEDIKNSVAVPEPNIEQLALNSKPIEKPIFKSNNDDDMVYFANTSFHKRTKFREVFRKASRVIEKVTSIGSANDASTQ